MIINIFLTLVGISGLIIAGSDGPGFPWINFLGLGAMCASAWAFLKKEHKNG